MLLDEIISYPYISWMALFFVGAATTFDKCGSWVLKHLIKSVVYDNSLLISLLPFEVLLYEH